MLKINFLLNFQTSNATLTKYLRMQKQPRWEFNLSPKRTFAYTAVPVHFDKDVGSGGHHVRSSDKLS